MEKENKIWLTDSDLGYSDNLGNYYDEEDKNVRHCTHCGKVMYEGYCIYDGLEYYCSDECLCTRFNKDEYHKMFDEGDAYWTEWDD